MPDIIEQNIGYWEKLKEAKASREAVDFGSSFEEGGGELKQIEKEIANMLAEVAE